MRAIDWLKTPLWAAGIAGGTKSFLKNPLIGDPELNARGLHRNRISLAWRAAERRRAILAPRVDPDLKAAFDRDGFVILENVLPDAVFRRMVATLRSRPLPAHEMRQGQTVTRMTPVGPRVLADLPGAAAVIDDRRIRAVAQYAASTGGFPAWFLQTVIAEPNRHDPDPQTDLHADTFHPTAKLWLFLQDVGEDDGPFMYVPGSHRLTPERLEWEYRMSLTARDDPRSHHAHGSFRVRPDELAAMRLPPPRKVVVKANTLVVADTFGFHARTPSDRPTLRMELHGHLRQNPFSPWAGPGFTSLPGIARRQVDIFLGYRALKRRWLKHGGVWKDVGTVLVDSPPHV
ncbi:phytanoyl-CoA dioxygenase family protein [Mongoliimonas terrestris]|uniref:phytanoyl-CoA dioxygenase family protein n=1 Tax=Mongoliimonas terrestris TaxID=1709001 RepID=UPI00094965F3|nr:phytanoyl-CoA dioxygenase family protein [Mongoliimonas terrestris]